MALVRCDMVGSSELLATKGVGAAIEARHRSSQIIEGVAAGGAFADSRGDGSVLAFESVQAALAAAWSIQQQLDDVDEFALRVAVMLDEVSSGDLFGGAVEQRAKAIEDLCPGGELVIDGPARRALHDKTGVGVEPLSSGVWRVTEFTSPAVDVDVALRAVLFSELATGTAGPAARAMSQRCMTEHDGVVLDTNGAGHLATFASCAQAVAAATALHAEAASHNLRADASGELGFRVAISVGDVATTADGAGFGLSVVESARLLELTDSGATSLSVEVQALADVTDHDVLVVGPTMLKGLSDVVDVRRIEHHGSPAALLEVPPVFGRDQRLPMTGRDRQLAVLGRRWSDTVSGRGTAAMISGEEGVGKTRLVSELAHQAHASGAIVLYGACDEDLRVPYAPIAHALRAAASLDPELEAGMAGDGPLGALLGPTTLGTGVLAGGSAPGRDAPDQHLFFDLVSSALARLAAVRPVLLVVDDVQWAELDTLGLVRHLIDASDDGRLLVVATCRSEHLEDSTEARTLLEPTRPGQRIEHIRLERLSKRSIIALLESHTGSALRGDEMALASKITEITGGSPLYVEELLVHLVETFAVVVDTDGLWSLAVETADLAIPESVLELMRRRAARLGPKAGEVLGVAALTGATFDVEVVADVTDEPIDVVLDIIEAAETARLVREVDAGQSYAFGDELSREAFLRDIRPIRRARVHKRVAESLELLRPNHVDQLAAHWSASPGRDASAKAVHYLRRAAERDFATAAWESAIERHRQVLDLLAADQVEDIELLGEMRLALGLALRLAGDDEHRNELMTAANLARKARNGNRLFRCGSAMMRPGAWYPEAGVVDHDIVAICEDALLLLDQDDPLQAHVMAALATNLAYDHDHERRAALVADAQQRALASGDLHMIGMTYAAELTSSHEPERFEHRRKIAEEVRRIGRATGDQSLLITGSLFMVLELLSEGDLDAAEPLLAELGDLVETTREYFTQYLVAYLGSALAVVRDEPGASEQIEAVRARFEDYPLDTFGMSLLQNGVIALTQGTLSGLLLDLVEATTTWDEGWGEKWNYALSRAYLDIGDEAAALGAIESKPEPDRDFYWLSSFCQLALLGMSLGLTDVCERVVEELTPFRGRFALIGLGIAFAGQVSTALAHAHTGLGQLEEATDLYREAAVQADEVGFPYFAVMARRHLAHSLLALDPANPEAPALLERVIADATRHGFVDELRDAKLLASRTD